MYVCSGKSQPRLIEEVSASAYLMHHDTPKQCSKGRNPREACFPRNVDHYFVPRETLKNSSGCFWRLHVNLKPSLTL